MTTAVRLAILCLLLVLLLGFGAWYYLFGPNKVDAAELVPGDTALFVTIPNGARIATGYETSHLKELADAPNAKPLLDGAKNLIGPKNLDLLQDLLPNLSGQSFIAMTKSGAHPGHGEIIGLRPKMGADHFDALIEKLKTDYPGFNAEVKTGAGQVEGLDYQWMQGPGVADADRICIARYRGWIAIAWGEDALRDWYERIQKKASSPSLAENHDYQESLTRVGKDFDALYYVKAGAATDSGTVAVGSRFAGGNIEDRFSVLMPRTAQAHFGFPAAPCPFDTLKFTGPDTRFYWGGSFYWAQVWKNLEALPAAGHPLLASWMRGLQDWAQAHNLDVPRDIIAPLGGEISAQVEWSDDSSYPDAGLFLKLDHPDAFKPVIAAIIDTVRQDYANRAVVNELSAGDRNYATLKFVQPLPVSPTITENGPYFGIFLNETHAVRSFQRDESLGLLKNADFMARLGDERGKAAQIAWLDSPRLADRAYQAALPYVSLAALVDRNLGAMLQNRSLPPDLHWLAPIGTWSEYVATDDEGLTGNSISGIGNQGLLLAAGAQAVLPALGSYLKNLVPAPEVPVAPAPAPAPMVGAPGAQPAPAPAVAPAPDMNGVTNAASAVAPPSASISPPAPDNAAPDTNAAAPPVSVPSTNATPPAPAPAPSE